MLAGWAKTPARFREDANAEQDAALGGYADRLVVELAQNAADAAVGGPGRCLLRWTAGGLLAANTGHPLTADGIVSLSTLRASAKVGGEGQSVGRFGVGFAAVLAVTDAPEIGSRDGTSIRWSAAETAALVAEIPSISDDVGARGGHVPVLRLPFVGPPPQVPEGYDTAVWLPWRDESAAQLGARLLADLDPTLLLTLTGLGELRVEAPTGTFASTCVWVDGDPTLDGRAWLGSVVREPIPDALRGERPAEERNVLLYEVRAFAPADGHGLPPGTTAVLRAPTVTDEPMSLPLVLIASVPLEPTRRRVLRGPLSDLVLLAAGRCIAALAARFTDPFPMVPTGLPAGDIDAAVRAAALSALREAPLLQGLLPSRCSYLDLGDATGSVADLLADEVAGLLPPSWSTPSRVAAIGALGIQRIDTAGVVALLADRPREPEFWRRAYGALSHAPDRDALGALPVPLLDGRFVTGARGALLPAGELPPYLDVLPVRLVHPDAVHPLLERLGARTADAAAILTDPAVRQAVERSIDGELPDDGIAHAVAALVAESGLSVRDRPWLAALALPAEGGGVESAADLVWPDSPMEALLDPEAGFRRLAPPPWLDRRTAGQLGVADRPIVTRFLDVSLVIDPDDQTGFGDLDEIDEWIDELARTVGDPDIVVPELLAVQDLDAIADLAGLLALVSGDHDLRAAIVEPAVVAGRRCRSYTAWWLARRPVFGDLRPIDCILPGVPLLGALYELAPTTFDEDLLRALGVRSGVTEVLDEGADLDDLLARLGDERRRPHRDDVVRIYAAIAATWGDRIDDAPPPPRAVRGVAPGGEVVAVGASQCVAVDAPDLIPLVWATGRSILLARIEDAEVLGDLLEVDVASDLAWPQPDPGVTTPVPQVIRELAPTAPATYQSLEMAVAPWRFVDGTLYATQSGLASGLAWAAGCWARRHLFRIALDSPRELPFAVLEELAD